MKYRSIKQNPFVFLCGFAGETRSLPQRRKDAENNAKKEPAFYSRDYGMSLALLSLVIMLTL